MRQNSERVGVLLVGIGFGILIVRLLPWLAWLWPLGLIVGGIMLWRRLGTPLARNLLIVTAATVGILGPGGWIGDWGPGRVVAHYEVGSGEAEAWRELETLVIRNAVGDVVVEGDADELSVEVTYRRGRPGGEPPEALQADYDLSRRTLTVVGVDPGLPERARRGLSARIEVKVPEGTRLELVNNVGDVEAEGLSGVAVQLNVGDVQLGGIAGPVKVQSDVGELELEDVRGPVQADLDIGEIKMSFDRPVDDPIRATTRVGDITLVLPSGSDVAVRAVSRVRGLEGDLQPVTASEGRLELGNGANEVYLETDVGEIEVERR